MDAKFRGFNEAYKRYVKSDRLKKEPIKNKKLARSMFEFMMKRVWKKMIEDAAIYKAPYGVGKFMVVERDRPGDDPENSVSKFVNWKKSEEQGKLVYDYNTHSGGIRHRFYWDKTLSKLRNKKAYRFKFARGDRDVGWGYRYLAEWLDIVNNDPTKGIYRSNIKP